MSGSNLMTLCFRSNTVPVSAALISCAALLFAVGCPGEDPEVIDIQQDTDAGFDDADVDDEQEEIDPTHCPSTSTVESAEPATIEIDEWLTGSPSDGDPIGSALRDGSFELPDAGVNDYGTTWMPHETGENGAVPTDGLPPVEIGYAGVVLEVEERTVAFARPDGIHEVYVNGFPQPGDVYSDGDKRVPIPLEAGENEIVLRFQALRGPEFELFETPDDLHFNTEDITAPDLRVGTDRTEQLGFHVVNLAGLSLTEVEARVVENDYFNESVVEHPAIGADSSTQIAFELEPKQTWDQPDEEIPVLLELASCQSGHTYQLEVELQTVAEDETFNRTFRSPIDNSVQYYGVTPPKDVDEDKEYGLAMSMHGASVEASSQAGQYAPKETMYIIAPTNRRPFGFDWEEWGRLNGLASLDHARDTFNIDDRRIYATGHSMGGHGTWHLGVMHPGRFAALAPSAGWSTFYSYSGQSEPSDLLEPARAHSDTYAYMSNIRRRSAYLLHGDEDVEVPLSEGLDLCESASQYTDDIQMHIEPGKDHWWDFDQERVDEMGWDYDTDTRQECLDWKPIMQFLKERELEPYELEFDFRTPGQWIGADHSYVSLESTENPFEDATFRSQPLLDDDSNDECEDNSDCIGDRVCHTIADTGVCLGTVDAPCEHHEDTGECDDDEDCEAGFACEESEDDNEPGQCIQEECTFDEDCGDGLFCEFVVDDPGVCVAGDECSGPTDCGPGLMCAADECVPQGCSGDGECDQGFVCDGDDEEAGECIPDDECTEQGDCADGYRCDGDDVEPGACVPEPCAADEDCLEEFDCELQVDDPGVCMLEGECSNDGDCAGHRICGERDGVDVCLDPDRHEDVETVELTTDNVRAMDIDAAALRGRGVEELIIDGESFQLADEDDVIEIGPRDGKNRDAPGLLNPTFHRPFCFVYPDDQAEVFRSYTANLLSTWSLRGNGHGCALPLELLTDEIADQRNLIYVGVDFEEIPDYENRPFEWDGESWRVGDIESLHGAGFVTFPHGDHQSAAFIATDDAKHHVFGHQPFTSRAGMPDFFFWGSQGGIAGGYFDADWDFDADLAAGG